MRVLRNKYIKRIFFICMISEISYCPCLYRQGESWEVLWVVLLMFGQLRPCFPQGEQSLTLASTYIVTLAHFSPHSEAVYMGQAIGSICTVFLQSLWAAVESKKKSTYSLLKCYMKCWRTDYFTRVLPLYVSFLLLHYISLIFSPLCL